MAQIIDDMAEIPMDGSEVVYEDENREIPPGEYFFRVVSMKRVKEEARGSMPTHVNVKFKLELETPEGKVGVAWDNVRMYAKFLWKYAELAKAIGHTPPDASRIKLDWSTFVGATGRVKLGKREWKKSDGTTELQNDFKYLPPPAANEEQPF